MRTFDGAPQFFNSELSLLSFQDRVLTLAEDRATPLAERLRFVAIVGANVDEFFMVRMAGLSAAASEANEEQSADGLTAGRATGGDSRRGGRHRGPSKSPVSPSASRRWRATACDSERWTDLTASQQATLTAHFHDTIQPLLTPFAMTLSPGHPLPRLAPPLARDRDDRSQPGRRSAALCRIGASASGPALSGDRR